MCKVVLANQSISLFYFLHCIASKQWTEVFPKHDVSYGCQKSTIPRSRYGHSVCFYSGKVYMYGGRNDEDGCFSAVVAYDIGKYL